MTTAGRPAPVADWVTIPELYADPFPIFERLRAEGGVHWVPAINRYLVTSYDAVHDTELDQETFSANEEGSLMIRAMGHSMLRKDDPEHYIERRAWQPVLRPGIVKRTWTPIFERNTERYLDEFIEKGPGADLVWDFASPLVAENLRAVIGLHNATPEDLQRWSTTMIAATGNYADDPVVWAKGEASYNEVDAALDEMIEWHREHPDDSLLSALLRLPDYQMSIESIRANVKMTIGGGLNEPRDAIGVAAWGLLQNPEQLELIRAGEATWDNAFDEAIRWVAPIGMYSRQTKRDVVLQGVHLPEGAKLGISLLAANRDENQWQDPARFDVTRSGEGTHLAFGKGVHVCLGAWVARAEVAGTALPRLFDRLPDLQLDPANPAEASGWVFRGMSKMPVLWTPEEPQHPAADGPARIAIVGSGPSGCYTAQALRRQLPDAEINVIDRLATPYGLVRHGVAADHQGTKDVASQFARLFEKDGVQFLGNIEIGDAKGDHSGDISLDSLRGAFDAVVLAGGLHADARLDVPGGDLAGVVGAGRITRLLNAHVHEDREIQSLGRSIALVGHGNVAMDVIRLATADAAALEGSDIDDEAREALFGETEVIHAIGRSLPALAKFDPVMLREIAELEGVAHVVHGVSEQSLADTGDVRSELILELIRRDQPAEPRVTVEWWFGYSPARVEGMDSVTGLEIAHCDGTCRERVVASSIVTAIGFRAAAGQELVSLSDEARETGRVEPGLYVAGWARRGPRGTIPSQRTDSRELAEVIVADLTNEADSSSARKPGRKALGHALAKATTYDGWLLIDAHEARQAKPGRVRGKITDERELRLIAGSALSLPRDRNASGSEVAQAGEQGEPITIAFGTESGNAELVAEELAGHLANRHDVRVVDFASLTPDELERDRLLMVVCSTYGDGELPTTVRPFHEQLETERPDLTDLTYAVFGLGDRSYHTTYSRGSEILDEALRTRGAQRVGEYGRHDAGGSDLAPALAMGWADALLATRSSLVGSA
ncbi:cytochrome P450 [Gulosibacter molinativorax]|uniref:Cytochrome P450 n=1 Tax=Gulosibacter molinativorax TaxID=256821 RepID=A0ABT7C3C2_9MICO|nr:cytochrome P450 [Gulosibacter molinativorax]MDJ1369782.1 cytochrome P450 [Gulosibacter molinativorax]QUY61747.1 Cytochrome P450-pinF2, plant-inducible [Gulosibacter molinativorax]